MEKFRDIELYKTETGRCPVLEFIETVPRREEQVKIMSVFEAVEQIQIVPVNFLKKLKGAEKLWEIRVLRFRFLGFYWNPKRLILVHAFVKQSQKTPLQEIAVAVKRKSMYLPNR